jgi:molybdopterin synthase sulfur carrier subunit
MNVTVKFFASLREQLGKSEVNLHFPKSLTVAEVWNQINPHESLPAHMLTAVNKEYVDSSTLVQEGDEVAFFPPVTGG